ncbi:S9 family peptidase [Undibacterium sp.]|uniref:S9 family peptidase n=1 Tax=Undibacterium sp. TaxID=1914977 RepID=UPI002BF39510|nr:prolyl oligopeptidase family serine peptidase [Undibacterium sp.]HTD03380.1 prolyl oligopeptidase family serine peptidase [Undibacterium sp.]
MFPLKTAHAVSLTFSLLLASGAVVAANTAVPVSQTPAATSGAPKRPITHDVYAGWRSIQGNALSRDGQWASYALTAQEGDGEIVARHLASGREYRYPRGTAPVFSADGRYVAFAIQPTRLELDKAKKDKKKPEDMPKPGMGMMDLATGKVEAIERVKRFALPEDAGSVVAVLLEPLKDAKKSGKKDDKASDYADGAALDQEAPSGDAAGKKKEAGTELYLINLATGKRDSYKDVAEFAWSKDGTQLAYAVSVKDAAKSKDKDGGKATDAEKDKEDKSDKSLQQSALQSSPAHEGVYVVNIADGKMRALLTGPGSYKSLSFDEAGRQLAFLTNRDQLKEKEDHKEKYKDKEFTPAFAVYYAGKADNAASLLVSGSTAGMPAEWAPSEHGALKFSKDGERLFLGTALAPKIESKDAPEPMKVDLWSWKDPELQPMQKVKAEKEKNRSYRAVVHLKAKRFVQLATLEMPDVIANDNARFALGQSDLPYRMMASWDALYYDAYAVDLQSGKASRMAEKLRVEPTLSPGGKYVLAFDAMSSTWWAYATKDGTKTGLTASLKVRFEEQDKDTPEPREPYGVAGWTAGDASVVLYDQFDLWEIKPDTGAAKNLTEGFGRKNHLGLRYVKLDKEEKVLPADKPWILAATNSDNYSSGYYQTAARGGEPKKLIHADKLISGLVKAGKADTILFTQQTFEEFPDLWTSDLNFRTPQKISHANPQQAELNWGKQELITYTNGDGKPLKALLLKPENFDPKKKYPMMVYIYEKMSDNLYKYVPPAPAQNINITRYASNGYIVLRPDIVYETGYPGKSAMKSVLPAIEQVIAQGFVDPQRVGIQGHSWGAYQITYMITQTNIFRAAEAGASMANMISGYGGIRWGTGMSRAFQYERSQSRIGGTPWGSPLQFIENSPIFSVDKVRTPYLTIHNDDDDAVPWYQAIEFFTAMRRLGKEAYWFNYNGEKHGLKNRENMKHYTVHMAEFFDHYLLDAPRPEWMEKPVPYLERGKRDVMGLYKTPAMKEAEAKFEEEAKAKAKLATEHKAKAEEKT